MPRWLAKLLLHNRHVRQAMYRFLLNTYATRQQQLDNDARHLLPSVKARRQAKLTEIRVLLERLESIDGELQ